MKALLHLLLALPIVGSSVVAQDFDVVIKNGVVYDGSGGEAQRVDVAVQGDHVAGLGDYKDAKAKTVIDAKGLVVAPGFINMLSHSEESLIEDGRSQSEIRQGVTTEIMGEGESMGPVNERMRKQMVKDQTDIKYAIEWSSLAGYLKYLEKRGVSCNVASFIGAATIRENVIGYEDKQPTPEQLDQMRELVRKEMEAGVPATNLGLDRRGMLKEGMFADIVVFDPETIADRATYENPHQYAIGMKHVFVNGVQVLKDGEHTGAKPGRALWGPGKVN